MTNKKLISKILYIVGLFHGFVVASTPTVYTINKNQTISNYGSSKNDSNFKPKYYNQNYYNFKQNTEQSAKSGETSLEKNRKISKETILTQKINQNADSLRNLTGEVEILAHKISKIKEELDKNNKILLEYAEKLTKIQSEFDQKILAINELISKSQESKNAKKSSKKSNESPKTGKETIEIVKNLIKKNRLSESVKILNNFIKNNKKSNYLAQAMFYRGYVFFLQKKFQDASADFVESYSLNAKSAVTPYALRHLALSLKAMNRKNEADVIEKKLRLDFPNFKNQNLKL